MSDLPVFDPNEIRKALDEAQVTVPEDKWEIILTKMIQVSRVPAVTIDQVLPFPIFKDENKEQNCSFCGRKMGAHNSMDFFVNDAHMLQVQRYITYLKKLQGETEALEMKLELEGSSSVMSSKDIMSQFTALLKSRDAVLVDALSELHAYYTLFERRKEETHSMKETLDSIQRRYNANCSVYLTELWWLQDRYGNLEAEEAKKQPTPYQIVCEQFSTRTKTDYHNLRTKLFVASQEVLLDKETIERFEKSRPYEKLRALVRRESERPQYIFPSSTGRYPTVRRRQR